MLFLRNHTSSIIILKLLLYRGLRYLGHFFFDERHDFCHSRALLDQLHHRRQLDLRVPANGTSIRVVAEEKQGKYQ